MEGLSYLAASVLAAGVTGPNSVVVVFTLAPPSFDDANSNSLNWDSA